MFALRFDIDDDHATSMSMPLRLLNAIENLTASGASIGSQTRPQRVATMSDGTIFLSP